MSDPRDEEQAAVEALDADTAAGRGDAVEFLDVVSALASAAEAPAPDGLKTAMLDAARARRRPLEPVDAPPEITAAESFARSVEDLRGVLGDLTPAEWSAPTATPYGRVRDLVAHLAGIEAVTLGWMEVGPPADPGLAADHVRVADAEMAALADEPTDVVYRRWSDRAEQVMAAAGSVDPQLPVLAHDIPTDVDGMLVLRAFEVWSHADDVRAATGRPLPALDPPRAAFMSDRLMVVLPLAMALIDPELPDATVRMVLTGPGGRAHDIALTPATAGPASTRIVVDVTDICRVAGRRLDPTALAVDIHGDAVLARRMLDAVGAFARD